MSQKNLVEYIDKSFREAIIREQTEKLESLLPGFFSQILKLKEMG